MVGDTRFEARDIGVNRRFAPRGYRFSSGGAGRRGARCIGVARAYFIVRGDDIFKLAFAEHDAFWFHSAVQRRGPCGFDRARCGSADVGQLDSRTEDLHQTFFALSHEALGDVHLTGSAVDRHTDALSADVYRERPWATVPKRSGALPVASNSAI